MGNLKNKVHWIDEWQNHANQPAERELLHNRLDVVRPRVSSQRPPDFLTDVSNGSSRVHTVPRKDPGYRPRPSISERIRNWCQEEISFSMNKISMFGLVFGLMILGSLFFVGGFLTAYSLYGSQPTSEPYQNTWAMANQSPEQHPYPASHSRHHMGEAIVGSRIHHETNRLESRIAGGTLRKLAATTPTPLRPFVSSAERHASSRVRGQISHAQRWPSSHNASSPHTQYAPGPQQQPITPPLYQDTPFAPHTPTYAPSPYTTQSSAQSNYGQPVTQQIPASSYPDTHRPYASPDHALPPHEDVWREAWMQEQRPVENAPYY